MVPVEWIKRWSLAPQLRRQDVPGDAVVQRGQVATVQLYPVTRLLLQEGPDDG